MRSRRDVAREEHASTMRRIGGGIALLLVASLAARSCTHIPASNNVHTPDLALPAATTVRPPPTPSQAPGAVTTVPLPRSDEHLNLIAHRLMLPGEAPMLMLTGFDYGPHASITNHVPWRPDAVDLPEDEVANCSRLMDGRASFLEAMSATPDENEQMELGLCYTAAARVLHDTEQSDTSRAAWVYGILLGFDTRTSEEILIADAMVRDLRDSPSADIQEVLADWSVLMLSYHGDASRTDAARLAAQGVWTPRHELLFSLHEIQREIIGGRLDAAREAWQQRVQPQMSLCAADTWHSWTSLACYTAYQFATYFEEIGVDPASDDKKSCLSHCISPPPSACEGEQVVVIGATRTEHGWVQDSPSTCLAGRGIICIRQCVPTHLGATATLEYRVERQKWDEVSIWPSDTDNRK